MWPKLDGLKSLGADDTTASPVVWTYTTSCPTPANINNVCDSDIEAGAVWGVNNLYRNSSSFQCVTSEALTPPNDPNISTPCEYLHSYGNLPQCVADFNEPTFPSNLCMHYENAWPSGSSTLWNQLRPIAGPNINCPVPILPLSGNHAQIVAKLDQMTPVPGGTLPDVGLLWSLRVLSPNNNWPAFWGLNSSQAPKAFDEPDHKKVIVLISDGKVEPPQDFEGYYGCGRQEGGFGMENNTLTCYDPFVGGSGKNCERNCWRSQNINSGSAATIAQASTYENMLTSACETLRTTYNINLYTILVDVNDANATALMQGCAGDPANAFNISAAQLDSTLNQIANTATKGQIRIEN